MQTLYIFLGIVTVIIIITIIVVVTKHTPTHHIKPLMPPTPQPMLLQISASPTPTAVSLSAVDANKNNYNFLAASNNVYEQFPSWLVAVPNRTLLLTPNKPSLKNYFTSAGIVKQNPNTGSILFLDENADQFKLLCITPNITSDVSTWENFIIYGSYKPIYLLELPPPPPVP